MSASCVPPAVRRSMAWSLAGAACVGLQWVQPAASVGCVRALGAVLLVASGALICLPMSTWLPLSAVALLTLASALSGAGPEAAWLGVAACLAWLALAEGWTRQGLPLQGWATALRAAGSATAVGLLVAVARGEWPAVAWYRELGYGQRPWDVPWVPGQPAALALVAVALPLAVDSWATAGAASARRLGWLELAVSTAALMLAGGWLGWLALGAAIVASAGWRACWRWPQVGIGVGALVLVCVAALPVRHSWMPHVQPLLASIREEVQLRVYAGHAAWRLLSQRPGLGWGPGSFGAVYGPARPGPIAEPFQAVERPATAPSDLLLCLVETGVPATLLVVALCVPACAGCRGHGGPHVPRGWRAALVSSLGVSAIGGGAAWPLAAASVMVTVGVIRGMRQGRSRSGPRVHCSWPRLGLAAVVGLVMAMSPAAEWASPARRGSGTGDPRSPEMLLDRACAVAPRNPEAARSLLLEALRVFPLREEAARRAGRGDRQRWGEVRLAHIAAADEMAVLSASLGASEAGRAYASLARQLRADLLRER